MIINYSLKELSAATKYMSILQRVKFINELKKKEKDIRRMERTLQIGSNIATRNSSPKKWGFQHNDIFE